MDAVYLEEILMKYLPQEKVIRMMKETATPETDMTVREIYSRIDSLRYEDAERYDIPTKEQFSELLESCQWEFTYIDTTSRKYTCIGPNGNHVAFSSRGYKLAGSKREIEKIFFWVKSMSEDSTKEAVYLYYQSGEIKKLEELFSGSMLPLRLVKKK